MQLVIMMLVSQLTVGEVVFPRTQNAELVNSRCLRKQEPQRKALHLSPGRAPLKQGPARSQRRRLQPEQPRPADPHPSRRPAHRLRSSLSPSPPRPTVVAVCQTTTKEPAWFLLSLPSFPGSVHWSSTLLSPQGHCFVFFLSSQDYS